MMMSEFVERVGFEPTAAEYAEIEQEYMGCDVDKDKFCKEWKKNGGIQRLCRMRARRIEELEAEVAMKDRQYEEMDARHSRQFNEMHSRLKSELEAATKRLENVQNEKDCLYGEIQKAKAAQKEAEEKLAKIREAFAILGIAKEV